MRLLVDLPWMVGFAGCQDEEFTDAIDFDR